MLIAKEVMNLYNTSLLVSIGPCDVHAYQFEDWVKEAAMFHAIIDDEIASAIMILLDAFQVRRVPDATVLQAEKAVYEET